MGRISRCSLSHSGYGSVLLWRWSWPLGLLSCALCLSCSIHSTGLGVKTVSEEDKVVSDEEEVAPPGTEPEPEPGTQVRPALLALLREFEGCRLESYRDGGGVMTVGYGHTGLLPFPVKLRPNGTFRITQEQAEELLLRDAAHAAGVVEDHVTVALTMPQYDALASLVFNVGSGSFRHSRLLKALNKGKYHKAAQEFLVGWDTVAGRTDKGLVRRRAREYQLFLTPPLMMPRTSEAIPAQWAWQRMTVLDKDGKPAMNPAFGQAQVVFITQAFEQFVPRTTDSSNETEDADNG